jgi:hypothetical protein
MPGTIPEEFLCTNSNFNVLVAGSNTMEATSFMSLNVREVEPGGNNTAQENKQDPIGHK